MCIFATPVKNVSKTKIFVAPLQGANRQLTIYQNSVSTDENGKQVVMILPFRRHNVHYAPPVFIDMTQNDDCRNFFKCIDEKFEPLPEPLVKSLSKSKSKSVLSVEKHGSYLVSVAKSFYGIRDVDSSVFEDMPKNVFRILSDNYYSGYGFIICKSTSTNENFEPIAYVTDIITTEPMEKRLFAPTRHAHPKKNADDDYEEADWDHLIYVAGATCHLAQDEKIDVQVNGMVPYNNFNIPISLEKDIFPRGFVQILNKMDIKLQLVLDRRFTRYHVTDYPNRDIILPLTLFGDMSKFEDDKAPLASSIKKRTEKKRKARKVLFAPRKKIQKKKKSVTN